MSGDNEYWNLEFADRIANLSISKFNSLGKTGKPKDKGEWTLLSCFIKEENQALEVVALGTGSKCLGENQLSSEGMLVHDSHAEVVARRAFMVYLLEQMEKAVNGDISVVEATSSKFKLKRGIYFHFYASHTPCGDASIFPKQKCEEDVGNEIKSDTQSADNANFKNIDSLPRDFNKDLIKEPSTKKMKVVDNYGIAKEPSALDDMHTNLHKQDSLQRSSENVSNLNRRMRPDIHRTGAKCVAGERLDPKLPGDNYHVTGVLRTKPGRGDPTLSMSCSDKIFKWTVLGVQGGLSMLLLDGPVYIKTITIGHCPYSQEAMKRALSDRFVERVKNVQLPDEFHISMPMLFHSNIEFPYSRNCVAHNDIDKTLPSPTSVIWSNTNTHYNKHEVATNGMKLGTTKKYMHSSKSMVSICRRSILIRVHKILSVWKYYGEDLRCLSYDEIKCKAENYYRTWETLRREVLCNWSVKPKYTADFMIEYSIE